jgi:nitrous oxidase accessory protein NosD
VAGTFKRGLLLAALAAVAAVLGTPGGAGAASILVVDDDGAQCPNAGFTTIADAIAAATAGDTILVCPGDYTPDGATTVDRRLSLVGWTTPLPALNQCSDRVTFPADQTTKNTIVAGFVVDADFVSIRGFTLTGAAEGVLVPGNASRTTVSRNVIQDNSIGINLNGTNNDADRNCIRDNDAGGSASGTGIYSDQGLKSTVIDKNVFFSNYDETLDQGAAITLLDTPGAGSLDDVHVTKNVASDEGDLISIAGSTNSEISKNTSTGAIGSGIFVEPGLAANTTLVISKNTLLNGDDEGIFVDVGALIGSTVEKNTAKRNATYGIHVSTANNGNVFNKNNFKNGGANNDCEDNSVGSGTAGTDNTWTKNKGKTASPPGICK